jgi:uncharacterized repeat protein (TIGR01451 family)
MKTPLVVLAAAVLLTCTAMTAAAATTTAPATGGSSISADLAQNGTAPAFTTLGSVVISESSNNDFKVSGTLILTAPSGWRFNPAAAITAVPGKVGGGSTAIDISASVGAITASSITVNITVNATARLDNLTISGIQVQAIEGGSLPAAGNILRSSANPGTAVIVGMTNDVTNFGSLSQALGALRLQVVLPGQTFTDGSTVAASGISGAPPSQAAGVAFNLVELVATDREFNVASTYSGAKIIAYAGPGGSPSYTTGVNFTGGHSTTSLATTLRKAETVTLSATSATSPAIAIGLPSASFAVDAGPVTKLQILLPGEAAAPGTSSGKSGAPTAQTSGVAILNNVRVNAVDADWNVISGAAPDVVIGSSDGAASMADDNGAAAGNLSLAAGAGTLSSFTFGTGGASQTITATDAAAALGAAVSASVMVNKPASATSVVSSQNPAVFGQSVTFTATVTGGSGTPTGTVDFKDGATVIASAVALDGSGVASFAPASLTVATHNITAVYNGSAFYAASTSANLSQVVNKASTAIALASSLNPSCAGAAVTFTATVSAVAPGAGQPFGNVDFKDGSNVIGSNVPLNVSGIATFTTSSLSAANHNMTAVYKGNGSFNTSTSTPVLVQAIKAKPTASVSGSQAICPGGSASIQAALGGTSPWTVTWSDGMVQSGVVSSPASRSVSPAATTVYSVTSVADAYCSNSGSGSATVTVRVLPAISGQPGSKIVCEGNSATFTVVASGTSITYQWRKGGVNLVNGGHVSGATSATLTISNAAAADAASYDVVVSGACPPAVTSDAASLTVNPRPSAAITAASLLCAGSAGNSASVPDAGPGASYAWSINNGTINGGASTSSIIYTAATNGNSLTLSVTVTSPNGCSTSSSKDVALSTGNVVFDDWKNRPRGSEAWENSTLSAKEMTYPEGGTIPYRITLPQPCVGTSWSITLQYDFADNATGVHFVDFLTSYNAYEGSVNGHACDDGSCTSKSTFPIPADGALAYQLPGVFTVENGTITSVSAYSIDTGGPITEKGITLHGTATPGADVMILFGAHLARDYEWGSDKGAHEWPSGTASVGYLDYMGGSGHTNVKISDNIIDNPSDSDLSLVMLDSPDPVGAGHNLTYTLIAYNSGPLAAIPDTVSDWIPAGTTFVSATAPAGWTMTTPAVGGTGMVRWVLPTPFAPSSSASFSLVVAVDAGASGTVENDAKLASGTFDAYAFNNTPHASTAIIGVCSLPVVSNDPADVNVCVGGNASFSASATGSPAPTIQWQVKPFGSGSFVDLADETAGTLSFAAMPSQSGNQYRAQFTNACGSTYSNAATLNWCPGNHAPSVVILEPLKGATFAIGDTVWFVASFTDDGGDSHTAVWTVGGVQIPGVVNDSTGTIRAFYVFTTAGSYTITLTVTDQDGAVTVVTLNGGQAAVIAYKSGGSGGGGGGPYRMPVDRAQIADLQFGLQQNTPNPFRNETQIHFSLPVQCHVKLGVFDIAGRQVASVVDGPVPAGRHELTWQSRNSNGAQVAAGVYFVRMQATALSGGSQFTMKRSIVLLP